jgi:hypothetical protein
VCTFASDVDLALWNVVIVPTSTKEEEGTHIAKHEKPAAVVDTHFDEKQDRVQKWKEALAELDAQQHEETSDEHDLVEQSIKKQPSLTQNDDSSVVMANEEEEEEENAKTMNNNGIADMKHNDDMTNTVIMA